jgi:hypothetical protein
LRADADGHVDVVAELVGAGRDRQHAGVRPGQVTGEEVEADEAHAGVPDGAGKRVDLGVGGHGAGERPPELDRLEAGRPGRRRPFQQRKLGEQQ